MQDLNLLNILFKYNTGSYIKVPIEYSDKFVFVIYVWFFLNFCCNFYNADH